MLELQNALMEVLQQLGALEIMALLAAVALLLIWLVLRVNQRKSKQTVAAGQRNDFVERAPAPVSEVPVNKPVKTSEVDSTAFAGEAASVQVRAVSAIPEDSVLRRHYLANQEAQRVAVTEPYQVDAVRHRHHDAVNALQLEDRPAAFVAPAVVKASVDIRPKLPQDSVLKRHFITQLQAEVEAAIAPRPSDSVLLRHHQALAAVELEKRLSAFKG